MNKRSAEESVEKGDEKASRSPSRKKNYTPGIRETKKRRLNVFG
jgi:hypothetical protein